MPKPRARQPQLEPRQLGSIPQLGLSEIIVKLFHSHRVAGVISHEYDSISARSRRRRDLLTRGVLVISLPRSRQWKFVI
jgi:hypothetical protein